MSAEVRIFELYRPHALDRPGIVNLFNRCYANEKFDADPDEVRAFVQQHLEDGDKDIRLWVASTDQHGYCGLSILQTGTCPFCPYPWISHFVAEVPQVREPLLDATIFGVVEEGHGSVSILNAMDCSDQAHMRLYRKYGTGKVKGSVIVYEIGDRYVR
jgi:hypothetical protein